ncbi:MAG: C4-dicarboxylate transporter DcuC [Oscillospiraceae bacterium]|nr:C4-dicarboxylate transporter DcuC [Oscillospiraceae bacterium]
MVILGIVMVVAAIVLIIKKIDAKIALFVTGAVMCVAGGVWDQVFTKFTDTLISSTLVPLITCGMGFSLVMEYTGCTKDLVNLLTKPAAKIRPLIVPFALLVTFVINISVTSAAACGAAVGALLIPLMLSFGVNPVIAASAVALGTWGNNFNPGFTFNVQTAGIAGCEPTDVIAVFSTTAIVALVVSMVALTLIDVFLYRRKATAGVDADAAATATQAIADAKVNPIKAFLPFLPIVLVIVAPKLGITLSVAACMMIGGIAGILVNYKDFQKTTAQFYKGLGNAFADIIGLMAAAAVFTAGMSAVGVTNALLDLMRSATSIAQIGATFGPLSLAAITGSGNSATIAFNEAVTPFAADFGYTIEALGAVAGITGGIGRAFSPVSGVVIILARMAKVDPMDVTKHAAIPGILAALVLMFGLL